MLYHMAARGRLPRRRGGRAGGRGLIASTSNPQAENLDLRGFDSSRLLSQRDEFPLNELYSSKNMDSACYIPGFWAALYQTATLASGPAKRCHSKASTSSSGAHPDRSVKRRGALRRSLLSVHPCWDPWGHNSRQK